MNSIKHGLPAACAFTVLQLALMQAYAAPLVLSNAPLFLTTANKPNILMLYGNSNSMDSDATGRAVGSTAATSKSEISRKAIANLIDNYANTVNMGLMAYQQYTSEILKLHDAQYDVSYDSANYQPDYAGPRNGLKKKFRVEVPAGSGNWIYYNVNLPGYYNFEAAKEFCYSTTACTSPTNDFMGKTNNCSVRETLPVGGPNHGPWDAYLCYPNKTGSNAQADKAPNQSAGYSGSYTNPTYWPTDADLGQGITDFGKRMASQFVSKAWFNNAAPGPGYLHVPVAVLDTVQIPKLKAKLATTQYTVNAPTDPTKPLQNSGLSPLAGSVNTARKYYNGTLTETSQGGSASAPVVPNSCGKNFLVTLTDGLPSVTAAGVASANTVAMLDELTTQVAQLKASQAKVETYVVGFALPYGVSVTQLDRIAAAGGSGTAHYADDPTTLDATFRRIFVDIMGKTSAASAVALNAQSLAVGGHVFQARFSSSDWSGQLFKLALREDTVNGQKVTTIDPTPVWKASEQVDSQSLLNQRTIITRKANGRGVPFRWTSALAANALDTAQIDLLNKNAAGLTDANGAKRLAYLRGVATDEGSAGIGLRARPTTKLGDIVNSAPVYVGVPDQNYGLPGHIEHRNRWASRPKMLYVGANDGMLHGFDLETGRERLAYVPGALFRHLTALTTPQYAHRYYVDGSPATSDVQLANGSWRTMLVSGMGGGARGVFGLDVTDPAGFSEANAASIVKFEYTDANDSDLGHISGPIGIAKLNNGRWAAIFGNGFASSGNANHGNAFLYIVDVENGSLIKKIAATLPVNGQPPAAGTSPNGLSGPLLIDQDNDDKVDYVYAGDLLGNMWKFDLSGTGQGDWGVSHKVFQAPAPITSVPEVGEHPNGGYIVYFGTGKYLEVSDIGATPASAPFNAMYGIHDTGTTTVAASTLVTQTFESITTMAGGKFRKATRRAVETTNNGWKLQFPTNGERVVSPPQLRDGRLIFTSMAPNDAACSTGGTSYFNQVNWLTGGELADPQFDTNGDQLAGGANDETVASVEVEGVLSSAAIQSRDKSEANLLNGSSGNVELIRGKGAERARRLSWRQLKK